MFRECSSLTTIPDISNWNTCNIEEINELFFRCYSLISLPDISKWKVNKVRDGIKNMFDKCYSLISLPDLSKWNFEQILDDNGICKDCPSLLFEPVINYKNK